MHENHKKGKEESEQPDLLTGKGVSRRDFLKIAGIAGAAVGAGAGLGGLLAACGEETTTTTAGVTTTGGVTTTAGATTTVSTEAEMGRELKFGFMAPITGPLAGFGTADGWCVDRWNEYAAAGSLVTADGKAHPMSVVVRDTQSDANRAGTVAGDLIQNDKVDILMAASTTDTTIPAALQAEALGCPCVLTDSPSDSLLRGVGPDPFTEYKWWRFVFWDNKALMNASLALYTDPALSTNKVVGALWPNTLEGNDRRDFYDAPLKDNGFKIVDAGNFAPGMEDYASIVDLFKQEGAEILQGLMFPPDWANFWRQCYQLDYIPKVTDIGIQTLFPTTMEALGLAEGIGICGQSWWHPIMPYKSSLTGETCPELCIDYETRTGQQWTQPIEHYMLFEWAVDALKRTSNADDKEEVMKNIANTKMETIVGPIDFTSPVTKGSTEVGKRNFPNVVASLMYMGQWVEGTTQQPWSTKVWPYELLVVEPSDAPMLEKQADPIIMPATTFT